VDTFDRWESFYVIVGSAAGALIGLQFVVMTLIAERPPPDAERAGAAFSTPTIVHLCVVLGIAALLRVPWESIVPMTTICAFVGVLGVIYCGVVARRMRVQVAYAPDVADWLCRVLLPLIAFVALTASGYVGLSNRRVALLSVGGATLLLLFAAIRNAWDAVSYHVLHRLAREQAEKES